MAQRPIKKAQEPTKHLTRQRSNLTEHRAAFSDFLEGLNWQLEQSGNDSDLLFDSLSAQLETLDSLGERSEFIVHIRHWLQNTGWLGYLKEKGKWAKFDALLSN